MTTAALARITREDIATLKAVTRQRKSDMFSEDVEAPVHPIIFTEGEGGKWIRHEDQSPDGLLGLAWANTTTRLMWIHDDISLSFTMTQIRLAGQHALSARTNDVEFVSPVNRAHYLMDSTETIMLEMFGMAIPPSVIDHLERKTN